MVGDALHVGFAHERLVAAAAFGAARRAGDVVGQVFEVLARHVDDAPDRADELRVVVIFVDPFAMGNIVDVVIPRRLFVERDRDVLFVDLDLVDVFERARIEQLGMRRLAGPARVVF